jgi:hypothetical protein
MGRFGKDGMLDMFGRLDTLMGWHNMVGLAWVERIGMDDTTVELLVMVGMA